MEKIDTVSDLQVEDSLPHSKMVSSYLGPSCAVSKDSEDFYENKCVY